MQSINSFIKSVAESHKQKDSFLASLSMIEKEHVILQNLLNSENPPFIYGVTSLVGHMDSKSVSIDQIDAFQKELIDNHALDIGLGYYNNWQVKCIFYSKLVSIQAGGTGISPSLFKELVRIYCDNTYQLKIPRNISYSCGEVIQGANFAQSLQPYFSHEYSFVIKDGISIINGQYVSLGLVIALLPRLLKSLDYLVDNTVYLFKQLQINPSILYADRERSFFSKKIYKILEANQNSDSMNRQPSVSLRSALKNIDLLYAKILELFEEVQIALKSQSDNPLVYPDQRIRSNSTFYNPSLAIKLSGLIDTFLFNSWAIERRTHYILSGKLENYSINFASEQYSLGLIQLPKIMTNIVQQMRLNYGTRPFIGGSEASYGIEDLWANTENLANQLESLMDQFDSLLSIEKEVISFSERNQYDVLKKRLKNTSIPTELVPQYPTYYVSDI